MKRKLSTYADWKKEVISIEDLYLDPRNIRIEGAEAAQEEIIRDLFINENAHEIISSLLASGFYPDERLVTVKEDGKYVVLEGNRRIAAVKIMLDPSLVDLSHFKSLEEGIGDVDATALGKLEVLVAPSRELADDFLHSKHVNITRRPWRPIRKAYFYYSQLSKGFTVEDLVKRYPNANVPVSITLYEMYLLARSIDGLDEATRLTLNNRNKFSHSTFQRVYTTPIFKEYSGISFDEFGRVFAPVKDKVFIEKFARIISDVANKVIESRSINSMDSREEYVKGIFNGTKAQNKSAKEPASDQKPIPNLSETSTAKVEVDYKQRFMTEHPGLVRRANELNKINTGTLPNASVELMRTLIEISAKTIAERYEIDPASSGNSKQLSGIKEYCGTISQTGRSHKHNLLEYINRVGNAEQLKHNAGTFFTPEEAVGFCDRGYQTLQALEFVNEQKANPPLAKEE